MLTLSAKSNGHLNSEVASIHISLLGKIGVGADGLVLPDVSVGKAQELLAYLLLLRDQAHHREKLATILWGEQSLARAKSYLRKALWQLQTVLEEHPLTALLLESEGDWLQINPAVPFWLDVAELEEVCALVHDQPGREMTPEVAAKVEKAVGCYRGDLLEGFYEEWLLYERERLQRIYLILLDKLMGYCEANGAYERGLTYGTQILRYDAAREKTHQRIMYFHQRTGNRTEALRQYERCKDILQEELGVSPSPRTTAIYEQIRLSDNDGDDSEVPFVTRLQMWRDQLALMQVTLRAMEQQVRQDIDFLDSLRNKPPQER